MDNKLAKQIVNEALNIAISKGCYGLIECSNIVKAIEYLNEQPDVNFDDVVEKEMD
jgi:hypothetical protein